MKSITAKVKGATGALADNPEVSPVAGKTNEWSFTMPAGDVEMEILYKTQSQLVLTFGGEEITSDGVTGYMSFEEEFSSSLSFSIEGLDAAMGFTFESSDATVMAFGDDNKATGELSDIKFLKTSETPVTLTVKFVGNDDYTAAEVTAEDMGKVIAADGNIYADADAATAAGTTALVKIAYVGSATGNATYNHGLAISLADEAKMKYGAAKTACSDKNTSAPVTGGSWVLPTKDQWNAMITAAGGFATLRSDMGLQSNDYYWSSTNSYSGNNGYGEMFYFGTGSWTSGDGGYNRYVRAVLVF